MAKSAGLAVTEFCRQRGVEVQPRPERLSGDEVSSLDVILYFLETARRELAQPRQALDALCGLAGQALVLFWLPCSR